MGTVKYPIIDRDVKLKMLGACADDRERGLVLLLLNTGMHPSVFCSPRKRNGKARERPKVVRDGAERYLQWKRPKTNKTLRSLPIRKDELALIEKFLALPTQSNKHYDFILERIGRRAGYDGVSCLTMRHTYCIWLLRPKAEGGRGFSIYQVPHWMGCTLEVAARNYSIMSSSQLADEAGSEDDTEEEE
jgi:integrase